MALKLLQLFSGYVKVKLTGFSTERFMNLCMKHNIKIWGVKNYGEYYILYMSRSSFKELKPIVKKTGTKVVILEKRGLPFFMFQYRKRKVFFAGILVFLGLIYLLSVFIWDIEVNGNKRNSTESLLNFLDTQGIQYGMLKGKTDCQMIEKTLRANFPDITWASARVDGTVLTIDVKEALNTKSKVEEAGASSLLAPADGLILSIITRSGKPAVKEADTVSKNQVLISGCIPVYDDSGEVKTHQFVNADGDMKLKTVYTYEDSFPVEYKEEYETGKYYKDGSVKFFHYNLNLHLPGCPYSAFRIIEVKHKLHLSRYFYLPVCITVRTIKETQVRTLKRSEEECIALANKRLTKFVGDLEEKGVQILKKNVKIKVKGKKCISTGDMTLILKEPIRKTIEENDK